MGDDLGKKFHPGGKIDSDAFAFKADDFQYLSGSAAIEWDPEMLKKALDGHHHIYFYDGDSYHDLATGDVKIEDDNKIKVDALGLPAEAEQGQHGDDRAPRYRWTPEQLMRTDPDHPEDGLEMPGYMIDLINEREKLEGRDPIPDEDGDIVDA